jgi:hypothetical protein
MSYNIKLENLGPWALQVVEGSPFGVRLLNRELRQSLGLEIALQL